MLGSVADVELLAFRSDELAETEAFIWVGSEVTCGSLSAGD